MRFSVKFLIVAMLLLVVSLVAVLPAGATVGTWNFTMVCQDEGWGLFVGGSNSGDADTPTVHFYADGEEKANAIIPAHTSDYLVVGFSTHNVSATVEGSSKVYHCFDSESAPAEEEHERPPTCAELVADNRVNSDDCGSPVAIYLGSLEVYSINPETGEGVLDLRVSDEVLEHSTVPEVNMLLAEGVNSFNGQPITVWRLSTGEFQVNSTNPDGSPYVFIWSADPSE